METKDSKQPEILFLPKPERIGDTFLSTSNGYRACRTQLLALLACASDIVQQIGLLQQPNTPNQVYRAVFPPGVLAALERGELHFRAAQDGLGFLPIVFDHRNIRKQVRIIPERLEALDRNGLAQAAANAATHALLRQVIVALHAIEKKVDAVLTNQRTDWHGRVAAGVQMLQAIEHDPGNPSMHASILANAVQSLEEGQQTGLLQLQGYIDHQARPPRTWWEQVWAGLKLQIPSENEAVILDRVQEDLEWLYVAALSSARVHQMSGRETLAREALPKFAATVTCLLDNCMDRYRFARYSSSRRDFWEVRATALRGLPEPQRFSIEVEFDVQEILEISSGHDQREV